jgi:ribonuclease VapC
VIAVDASALLAILLKEREGDELLSILEANAGVISPVNYWEIFSRSYVAGGPAAVIAAEDLVANLGLRVASLTEHEARRAFNAFTRFGKGVGGPLNLGDCFAYALAEAEGDGLLYKGDDFGKTDVASALA